jgi:hypothetical protein
VTVSTSVVEIALRTHLLSSAPLVALLASPLAVYRREAPPGADEPFVLYQRQDGLPLYTLDSKWGVEARYIVKAITRGHSTVSIDAIDVQLEAALGDVEFSVAGGDVLYCRRESDVDYHEDAPGGVRFNHRGGTFRIWTT